MALPTLTRINKESILPIKIKCRNCDNIIYMRNLNIGDSVECIKCNVINWSNDQNVESISDEEHESNKTGITPQTYKGQSELIKSKHLALSTISATYKIMAVLFGVAAFFGLFYGISMLNEYGVNQMGIGFIAYSILGGSLGVVSLLAISEGIKLFIDVENNTFRQNSLIEKLIDKIK